MGNKRAGEKAKRGRRPRTRDEGDQDPRQRAAIEETLATGVPPYAPEAVAAREDAHDRATARSMLAELTRESLQHAHSGARPPEPLGPIDIAAPTAVVFSIGSRLVGGADLWACLLPDRTAWSVYRCDTDQWIIPSYVGLTGCPWCRACASSSRSANGDAARPRKPCDDCRPIEGLTEPPERVDPASADPYRWPIGVRWTWTHAEMEDYLVGCIRIDHYYTFDVARMRTVRSDGAGGVVVTHDRSVTWQYDNRDLWAFALARRLTKESPDGAGAVIGVHDAVVGLAEARHAVERLAFVTRREAAISYDPMMGDEGHCRAIKHEQRLRGWIGAVEALLRNRRFYLDQVLPYEARLIEAASRGLVSADASP